MYPSIRNFFGNFVPQLNGTHQQFTRRKIFYFPALTLGLACALAMHYFKFSLYATLFSSLAMSTGALAITFAWFSPIRHRIINWIDDIIHPPVPKKINAPIKDSAKAKSYQEILARLVASKSEPIDIDTIKENLRNLFELRSYMPLTKEKFEERWQNFEQRYKAFQKTITDETKWTIIENATTLKELALDAAIISEMMFAVLEKELRDEGKEVTTQTVSEALCDRNKNYNARFLQGAIVDLYNFARGNTHYEHDLFLRPNRPSETNPDYYEPGIKNDVRKIYNTFIKKGFYQRYGSKAFKKELSKDSRFEKLVQVDSAKVRYFRAFADR